MLQTIIFDVDGTLLDTETIYMQAWREAGALHGYNITQEALLQTRAVNMKLATEIFSRHCGKAFDYEAVRADRVRISEQIIAGLSPSRLQMPQARQVLSILKERGYQIATASSTGLQKSKEHLAHAELLELIDVVVGGDMVENGKPAPDIFLKAASLCGCEPKSCIVVGDTPADVLAANAAGMDVVLIPDHVPPNDQTRTLSRVILKQLADLPDWLSSQ